MLPRAKDGDAHAFQFSDHQMGIMPRHPRMGKPRQIGIGDRHALHRLSQMAKPRAEDQAEFDRFGPGAGLDEGLHQYLAKFAATRCCRAAAT